MCTIKRKLEKLILKGDPEGKQRVWNITIKKQIGAKTVIKIFWKKDMDYNVTIFYHLR